MMSPEIYEKICTDTEDSANFKLSITNICKKNGASESDFRKNLADEKNKNRYASARANKYRNALDAIHDLEDEMIGAVQECDCKCSNAVATAYKIKIDNLKWIASKLMPKEYGDAVQHKLTDGDGKPLAVVFNVPRPDDKAYDSHG